MTFAATEREYRGSALRQTVARNHCSTGASRIALGRDPSFSPNLQRAARCLPRAGSAAGASKSSHASAAASCYRVVITSADVSTDIPVLQWFPASNDLPVEDVLRAKGVGGDPFHPRQAPPSTPGAIARKRYQSATTHIDAPSICPRLILPALGHV